MEVGYIENGYLRSKILEPIVYNETNRETGEVVQCTISVEEQFKALGFRYKNVDRIDDMQMVSDDEQYLIIPVPYDAGDRITYRYDKVVNFQGIREKIQRLKDQLTDSDYKITKCYEASLLGEQMPYDIQAVHSERQAARDRINELEDIINLNI